MRRGALAVWMLMALLSASAAFGTPSGEDIIAAVRANMDAVNDYQAEVTVTAKGKGISIKGAKATVYYKKPDKLHIEPKQGVAILPSGTFFAGFLEGMAGKARPVYVKSDQIGGRDCHVVRLEPKADSGALWGLTLWVDQERSVILATEAAAEHGFRTKWRYATVERKYYLPVQIDAEMPSPGDPNGKEKVKVTIKLTDYRVNKGISDKVFKQKHGGKK